MAYDSTQDTIAHIERVRSLLKGVEARLAIRGSIHDYSKLHEPEKSKFDEVTPRLKGLTYGSAEYKASLKELGVALDHHYKNNRHHPEYHAFDSEGILNKESLLTGEAIGRMTLLDIVEMLMDWKAASERHDTGDIRKSIEQNQERFGYSDELKKIMLNTADELNW